MQRSIAVLLAAVSLLAGRKAAAQCGPVTNVAQCPPCPAMPRCREPLPDYMPTYNGCGPEKFSELIENGVIPQGYGEADFRNGGCTPPTLCGCNQHDVCYGTCKSVKSACDNAFHKEMERECAKKYPVTKDDGCRDGVCFSTQDQRSMCMRRARLYADLVSGSAGQAPYDDAQKKACQCCEVPTGMAYCVCLKKCYPSGSACLAECRTRLNVCNVGICRPPTPDECPPP